MAACLACRPGRVAGRRGPGPRRPAAADSARRCGPARPAARRRCSRSQAGQGGGRSAGRWTAGQASLASCSVTWVRLATRTSRADLPICRATRVAPSSHGVSESRVPDKIAPAAWLAPAAACGDRRDQPVRPAASQGSSSRPRCTGPCPSTALMLNGANTRRGSGARAAPVLPSRTAGGAVRLNSCT